MVAGSVVKERGGWVRVRYGPEPPAERRQFGVSEQVGHWDSESFLDPFHLHDGQGDLAFGLAVDIPAVLGYNALTRANKAVLNKLNRFAHQLHAYFITGSPMQNKNTITKLTPRKEG